MLRSMNTQIIQQLSVLSTCFLPDVFFYPVSILLVLTSLMVVLSAHPIYSLLFLIASFILSAFLLLVLECEFLALIFVLIYVGAVAILFLFAAMMLEAKSTLLNKNSLKHFPFIVIYFLIFLIPLFYRIKKTFSLDMTMQKNCIDFYSIRRINWFDAVDLTDDIRACGHILYSFFVVQFLVTGLILLLITICVVHLTTSNSKTAKKQNIDRQLARRASIF